MKYLYYYLLFHRHPLFLDVLLFLLLLVVVAAVAAVVLLQSRPQTLQREWPWEALEALFGYATENERYSPTGRTHSLYCAVPSIVALPVK